jgi:L-fucose isomerase-like protein
LQQTKYLVYQDDPGQGFQAPIFKRFYWWEDECSRRLKEKFGISIVKKSFREMGAAARSISDVEADEASKDWNVPTEGLSGQALRSAVKLYLAVKRDLDADPTIRAAGINCLNESHFSDTTPCLAWSRLYQERGLLWGCEADTMSMISKHILHRSLGAPIMMTNLYPFLLGHAALKHERIESFPPVESQPENHVLIAHCGYMGVIPRPFATEWTLRKKVLAIVDDNASVIDAQLQTGDITLAKLHPSMDKMTVAEGTLTGYSQFPGSDCVNGGVVKIRNGRRLMGSLASHHYLLLVGHHLANIEFLGRVFGFEIKEI